jgi:hypothetical protein
MGFSPPVFASWFFPHLNEGLRAPPFPAPPRTSAVWALRPAKRPEALPRGMAKIQDIWDKGGKHHGNTGNMGNRVKIEICAKFWFQGDLKSVKPTFRPTVVLLVKKIVTESFLEFRSNTRHLKLCTTSQVCPWPWPRPELLWHPLVLHPAVPEPKNWEQSCKGQSMAKNNETTRTFQDQHLSALPRKFLQLCSESLTPAVPPALVTPGFLAGLESSSISF